MAANMVTKTVGKLVFDEDIKKKRVGALFDFMTK